MNDTSPISVINSSYSELEECIALFFLDDGDKMDINPATQLSQDEYQSFLEHATPEELDSNIMTKNTYKKVTGIKRVCFNYWY